MAIRSRRWITNCRCYVSEERVTTLAADNRVARSQVAKAQADLQAQRQQVASLEAELKRLDALILSAQADLEQADLNLSRTQIHAPISGLVGQRSAREGQIVQSGAYLLSLVPDQDIWIQANFKETQIGRMRPGQKAERGTRHLDKKSTKTLKNQNHKKNKKP